ncbi:MAG TPA: iron-containing alcohol dehydrogenase, partial [Ohtaekwangia sp.]
ALEGLSRIAVSLPAAYNNGNDLEARTNMAFASYLSGITLANAGLGAVHGFASSVGGYFDIPHGVICSALMAPANEVTVRKLQAAKSKNAALEKYARVGKLFSPDNTKPDDYYIDSLIALIKKWTAEMNIPKLSQFGVNSSHIEKIVHVTDSKNNPVALNKEELTEILEITG